MYNVVRHIEADWRKDTYDRPLAIGGAHQDLRDALVEASARNLIDAREGLAPTWVVESDRDEDYDDSGRLITNNTGFDRDDIRAYLNEGLGLSDDEIQRLMR